MDVFLFRVMALAPERKAPVGWFIRVIPSFRIRTSKIFQLADPSANLTVHSMGRAGGLRGPGGAGGRLDAAPERLVG